MSGLLFMSMILCGAVSAIIANQRGRSPLLWFILGLFGTLLTIIVLLLLKPNVFSCSSCREPIDQGFQHCPNCGQPPQIPPSVEKSMKRKNVTTLAGGFLTLVLLAVVCSGIEERQYPLADADQTVGMDMRKRSSSEADSEPDIPVKSQSKPKVKWANYGEAPLPEYEIVDNWDTSIGHLRRITLFVKLKSACTKDQIGSLVLAVRDAMERPRSIVWIDILRPDAVKPEGMWKWDPAVCRARWASRDVKEAEFPYDPDFDTYDERQDGVLFEWQERHLDGFVSSGPIEGSTQEVTIDKYESGDCDRSLAEKRNSWDEEKGNNYEAASTAVGLKMIYEQYGMGEEIIAFNVILEAPKTAEREYRDGCDLATYRESVTSAKLHIAINSITWSFSTSTSRRSLVEGGWDAIKTLYPNAKIYVLVFDEGLNALALAESGPLDSSPLIEFR